MTPGADGGGAAPSSFFVSYAREDQAFVRRLYAALDGRGRAVWVDWEAVPALADWRSEVTAAIEAADVFVFVISDAARDESRLARGRDLEAAQHWLAESALRTERDVRAGRPYAQGGTELRTNRTTRRRVGDSHPPMRWYAPLPGRAAAGILNAMTASAAIDALPGPSEGPRAPPALGS